MNDTEDSLFSELDALYERYKQVEPRCDMGRKFREGTRSANGTKTHRK